jgi:hypothetical protein
MPSTVGAAVSMPGAWSRKVWISVVALTAIGLVGTLVTFVGFLVSGPWIGGCGGVGILIFVLFVIALALLGFVALNGVLASIGAILLWRRSRWGPLLMIPSNFLTMAAFVYLPVQSGQVVWAAVVLLSGAAAACAVGLLLWALWTRERGVERVVELIVLGLIALPLVAIYVVGVDHDMTAALMPPLQAAAPGHC